MLLLRPTTDTVQLLTAESCDVDVIAEYVDRDTTSFAVEGAVPQYTTISTATSTAIVTAPGAGKSRNVKGLLVKNSHGTTWATVIVVVDVSGVDYELCCATLRPHDTLAYVEGTGFQILRNSPNKLNATFMVRGSDYTPALAGLISQGVGTIPNLRCPGLTNGVYYNFLAHIYHVSSGSTNGARFAFNMEGNDADPSIVGTIDTVTTSVTGSVHSAGATVSRNTAITAQTTGSANLCLAIISGATRPVTNNTALVITCEPELAASLTVKIGSWFRVWEATG